MLFHETLSYFSLSPVVRVSLRSIYKKRPAEDPVPKDGAILRFVGFTVLSISLSRAFFLGQFFTRIIPNARVEDLCYLGHELGKLINWFSSRTNPNAHFCKTCQVQNEFDFHLKTLVESVLFNYWFSSMKLYYITHHKSNARGFTENSCFFRTLRNKSKIIKLLDSELRKHSKTR